jgi:hypothetical protein
VLGRLTVRPSALNVAYNTGDKKWHAGIASNADKLKTAPKYKYARNS